MDPYEATKIVFSRIQNLEKENASKIMGLLLIQDHGEKEMIRLAFGSESYLNSVISQAKADLRISSSSNNISSLSSPSSPFISLSRQNSSSSTISRLGIPNSGSNFSNFQTPDELIIPNNNNFSSFCNNNLSSPSMNLSSPFYGSDSLDEFQLQDHHQLSLLNENTKSSSELFYSGNNQDLVSSPNGNYGDWGTGGESINGLSDRRSCSVSDICLGSDDSVSGFGWKPCLYYARGFCKNGASCRFLHGDGPADPNAVVGLPSKLEMMEQFEEMLRSKSAQQQQQQSQRLASASFPYSSSKCMNILLQNQQNDTQRAAAALMMGEEMQKLNRSRFERNNFPMNGCGVDVNPGSRQIYLTFPADSTFREEDVSNYFSIYGPVQDVRIPYQQKRMFGFVTFVYADTVKIILAKGNPHFVCDARVLVKPYKEKCKVPDKYRKQQVDRADYSACNSPTGLDPRDPFDTLLGPRMFYNNQDMLWRRKLEEQADLQRALELQSRRLMSLQLLDVKKQHHRALSAGGAPIGSPLQSPSFFNQSPFFHSDRSSSSESPPENCSSPGMAFSDQTLHRSTVNVATEKDLTHIEKQASGNGDGKENSNEDDNDLLEDCLEHNLPDSPFASPTKAAGENFSAFSNEATKSNLTTFTTTNGGVSAPISVNNKIITSSLLPAASCYFPLPRFSSGHGAIGM